jgi:putative transposase
MYAELRLGQRLTVSRKRVAGLLRLTGAGLGSAATPTGNDAGSRCRSPTMTGCRFVTDAPNRLWCTDVAEHPTATGKLYCCAVVDVFSRVIVGSSISDHRRAELVVDALRTADWRRRPRLAPWFTATRGSVNTSWVFGHRLPEAGLLRPMGRLAS